MADFFHIDTTLGTRLYALAFREHGTRRLLRTRILGGLVNEYRHAA